MGWLLDSPDARVLATLGLILGLASCASGDFGVPHGPAQPATPVLADLQMVRVPGGLFRMGNAAGPESMQPPHLSVVQPFHLSAYAITVGQFAQFVRETGYHSDAELKHGEGAGCRASASDKPPAFQAELNWRNPGFAQSERHPVVCVSYNDTHAFLAWLNGRSPHHYRLPSEAEWEFAARADSSTEAPMEACARDGSGGAACSPVGEQPVGSSKPNRFGLYDLLSPGSELVEDCWHPNYRHAPRVGYAWLSQCDQNLQITIVGTSVTPNGLTESRAGLDKHTADNHLGFHIAEDVPSSRTAGSSRD